MTSTTGQPQKAAISALAPVCPISPGTPSNRPIEPSATTISAASAASPAIWPSKGPGIAKLSRLALGAPVAAAWKAGSI